MMKVTFPGGVMVDATFDGHTVRTDQPRPLGEDTAMSPFDLFIASIATCMGFYALRFCQQREIDTTGLALELDAVRDEGGKMVRTMRVMLHLPAGFPEKYREAIHRSVDLCAVKKHLHEPPAFEIVLQG